ARAAVAAYLAEVDGIAAVVDDRLGHRLGEGEELTGAIAEALEDLPLGHVGVVLDLGPERPARLRELSLAVDQPALLEPATGRVDVFLAPAPREHVRAGLEAPHQLREHGDLARVGAGHPRRDVAVAPVLPHEVRAAPHPPHPRVPPPP